MTPEQRQNLEWYRDNVAAGALREQIAAALADVDRLVEACEAALADMFCDEVSLAEPAYSIVAAAIAQAKGQQP